MAELFHVELVAPSEAAWPVPWEPVEGIVDGVVAHVSFGAVRAVVAGLAVLPPRAVEALVGGFARIARRVDARHTRAARVFIDRALGPLPEAELERRVLGAWRHLFRIVYESEVLPRVMPLDRVGDHFEVEMCAEARALMGSGRGCVIVTPHLGNWEAAVTVLPRLGFGPSYAVARPPRNRPMSIATQRTRERFGARTLHRNGAMKSMPSILRAGGCVVLLADQRGKGRPVVAPFFGHPALCERAAGVLLRRLSAPVLMAACTLTERPFHYRVSIPRVLQPERLAGLSPEGIVATLNRGIEELVLERPEQYFWLHDRYRNAPEEVPDRARLEAEVATALGGPGSADFASRGPLEAAEGEPSTYRVHPLDPTSRDGAPKPT
jgi:Kdo2-lipid IVA lauroyltransferase/acyltransferase